MIDPDLKHRLIQIEAKLEAIRRGPSVWKSLVSGAFSGAGYVIGGIIIIFILGWFLAFLGIIPGLSNIVNQIKTTINIQTNHSGTSTRSL